MVIYQQNYIAIFIAEIKYENSVSYMDVIEGHRLSHGKEVLAKGSVCFWVSFY